MNPTIYNQWGGDAGTFQTVYMMKELVNKSYYHPFIRERAATLVSSCNRNPQCEARVLLNYVQRTVRYVRDPTDIEALHDPVTFYEERLHQGLPVFGDCDDMSIYLATLLKSIGHRPKFRVVSRDKGQYHHIYVLSDDLHLDPTMDEGRYPRNPGRAVQIEI